VIRQEQESRGQSFFRGGAFGSFFKRTLKYFKEELKK